MITSFFIQNREKERAIAAAALSYSDHRLLSGVLFNGSQVWPGLVVGGSGLLSGTATKFGVLPPLGPVSRKMPPFFPVF